MYNDNYIYIYNLKKFLYLPAYPDRITDTMSASFNPTSPLSRSAPIFSYSNSGPRTLVISLSLHREMLWDINHNRSNFENELGDDYVDTLLKYLQAIVFPSYSNSDKLVDPPLVAIRFGNEVFIKGVVTGGINIIYNKPLLEDNKYALINIDFTVAEVDPYDAQTVANNGGFRGISHTLERRIYKR